MKTIFLIGICFAAILNLCGAANTTKPNIVYLMADDLGWSDISANPGGTIQTPNIDRLFNQGQRLNNFMGWCVCSPTRAMLLTGRHPFRVGTGPEVGGELEKAETTIAEGFKAHGYRTGVFGKWHNGEDPATPEFRAAFQEAFASMPNKKLSGGHGANEHGFDEAWVYYGGGADFFTRRISDGKGPVSWWHNREFRPKDAGYTEDFIVHRAMEFIRENKDTPFFCYVPFHIVHTPLQAKDSDLLKVDPKITDPVKRTYAAMMHALDQNVAAIVKQLEELKLINNTIIVFTSDNGATKSGSNLPLKGSKHSVSDGGVRLPTAIHWPNGGLTSGKKWDGLCGALDMFPTLMAMANLKMPDTRPLDGKNIWPALRDDTASPVESYYWAWRNADVIRTADWKLHRFSDRNELYEIRNDESEARNVADAHPEVVKSLTDKMNVWSESTGAMLTSQPTPKKLEAKPAPESEVLEVTVTVTSKAKPNDRLIVPIANLGISIFATDCIEYDVAIAEESLAQGFYYSPLKGNDNSTVTALFKRGEGIDQFGREQSSGPAIQSGAGTWEHRIIGLCSYAPGTLPRHGLVFKGGKAGTYKLYLDNLRLRRADGSTEPIWTDGKNTRFRKIDDSENFTGVRVRTVAASEVGK